MSSSIESTVRRLKYVLFQRGVGANDVEDIVQDAFQRLENYAKTHEVDHVEGFLVRTAVNISIDRVREQQNWKFADESVENIMIADEAPRQDEIYAARERLERLNEGFAELDIVTRQMIRSQRIDGLSVSAIAVIHNMSPSAVEKRLAKGLRFLVDWMDGW